MNALNALLCIALGLLCGVGVPLFAIALCKSGAAADAATEAAWAEYLESRDRQNRLRVVK